MFEFKDQVVIDTGSGSKRGIGRGIANMFAETGANVIIADMNEQGCTDTVAEKVCSYIRKYVRIKHYEKKLRNRFNRWTHLLRNRNDN